MNVRTASIVLKRPFAIAALQDLIAREGVWFACTPYPEDEVEISVKAEHQSILEDMRALFPATEIRVEAR